LQQCGASIDNTARPDFDGSLSHRLYLQLLGATNTCKDTWESGRQWEAHNAADGDAEATLAAVGGRLWQVEDTDFVIQHSVSQTFRQWYAANEERNLLRTKWAEFFQAGGEGGGGFDAVLMPIYPLPAIEHDHEHDDVIFPHNMYGPYWRPAGRSLTIDGNATPYHDAVFWSGLASVSFLPSTAFPACLGPDSGLPVGLQLVGPEGGDYLTVALAGLLEKEAGFVCHLPAMLPAPAANEAAMRARAAEEVRALHSPAESLLFSDHMGGGGEGFM
jgi:amidase